MTDKSDNNPEPNSEELLPWKSPYEFQVDNEWVKFLDRISKPEDALKYIDEYLDDEPNLTERARSNLRICAHAVLNRLVAVTYIQNDADYMRFYDDKSLLEALLPLGLTHFDITPRWAMYRGSPFLQVKYAVNAVFRSVINKSKGGRERLAIMTQRSEVIYEERAAKEHGKGVKEKITDLFKG